jgi:IS30 family transposase
MESTCYRHLSMEEREDLMRGLILGLSLRVIARNLKRSPGTISRELARNARSPADYRATKAFTKAQARARKPRRPRKLLQSALWKVVLERLLTRWSPEQIAARLKMDYPNDESMHVSHETIYATLYLMPRGSLRKELLACLRQARKRRHPRTRGQDRRGQMPNMTSIHERPDAVDQRQVPGHWEGDLLKGARNASAIGTLAERHSRYIILARLEGLSAEETRLAFERRLRTIPEALRQSLTYDRGKEMVEHEKLTQRIRIRVFFADPHSPWQRGTIENLNGLLRQYLPKGSNLEQYSQRELNTIAASLNNRPRKCLGWYTPTEVFLRCLNQPNVALGS